MFRSEEERIRSIVTELTELLEKVERVLETNEEFFVVTHVAREDVRAALYNESIISDAANVNLEISEDDMVQIADKLGDALGEMYWVSLPIIAEHILKDKLEDDSGELDQDPRSFTQGE